MAKEDLSEVFDVILLETVDWKQIPPNPLRCETGVLIAENSSLLDCIAFLTGHKSVCLTFGNLFKQENYTVWKIIADIFRHFYETNRRLKMGLQNPTKKTAKLLAITEITENVHDNISNSLSSQTMKETIIVRKHWIRSMDYVV